MMRISLKGDKYTLVDDDIYQKYSHLKWHLINGSYVVRNGKWKNKKLGLRFPTVILHRIILGARDGEEVDHINRDTLDNRRCNLRIVDRTGNCQNKSVYKNNKCGYMGVQYRKGRWYAKITVNKKRIHLGGYDSATLASEAYFKAREKMFI